MTNVVSLPGQPQMQAEVILASTTALAPPLYTIRGRMPRCIWPEVLTHRVFGRNARSSRAVPIIKMIEEVSKHPFVPWHWGSDQAGMQAGEECDESVITWTDDNSFVAVSREEAWKEAAQDAAFRADAFRDAGYHKQIVNRLLEPYMWIDVLITTNEIQNFLWLRNHEDAEPHLQDWARLVHQAIDGCSAKELKPGEWHLPYIDTDTEAEVIAKTSGMKMTPHAMVQLRAEMLRQISAARCARISYAPFGQSSGNIDADLKLYEKLVGNNRIHASPMEHQATPDTWVIGSNNRGRYANAAKHGNLSGWVQHRKLIPNERWTVPDRAA